MGSELHFPVFAQLFLDQATDPWPSNVPPESVKSSMDWKIIQPSWDLSLLMSTGAINVP